MGIGPLGFGCILVIVAILWIVVYAPTCATETFNIKSTKFNYNVQRGQEVAKSSNLVIVGMLRDNSSIIPLLKKKVDAIGNLFANYHVFIVENDSKDSTRSSLLRWSDEDDHVTILGCGVNVGECTLNLQATPNHDHTYKRIEKMSHLRNIYLDFLKQHTSPDYVLCLDMDLDATIHLDGILSSVGIMATNPDVTALCANSIISKLFGSPTFYDTYPLIVPGDPIDWDNTTMSKQHDKDMHVWAADNVKPGMDVDYVPVTSCFSGMTLYRANALLSAETAYSPPPKGRVGCEHTYLNNSMRGTKGINPNMIVSVRSF